MTIVRPGSHPRRADTRGLGGAGVQHTAYVLDIIDDQSRYLLAAIAADGPTGEAARDCFEEAASRYGRPRVEVRSPHGV